MVTRDVDGNFVEFIIRIIEDVDDISGTFKSISAEGGEYELIDEFLPAYKQTNVKLDTALSAILQGTRWSVGEIDDFYPQSIDLKNMTVKNAVYELIKTFKGEVRYRVEIDGNRISKRYIDVFKKRGQNLGKRFEDGKDIISTSRTLNSEGIKTALFGRGASGENGKRLDFSDVEWSVANGDPVDKPLGIGWVGDENALATWGYDGGKRHKFDYYDGQEEDPATLLLNTWQHLQTLTKLRDTYEIGVMQLAEIFGFSHEKVRLGDISYAINKRLYPHMELETSIIEYRHNLNNRRLSEATLGHFRSTFDLSERLHDVEKDWNDKRGEFDKKPSDKEVDNKILEKVNDAIDEAQERIDQAKEDLEQAITDLDNSKLDLDQAQDAIDDIIANPQNYKGYFDGDIIANNLTLTGTMTSQYATITGTINANNMTLQSASIRDANIIDANIQNATITGTLSSVDGTFTGDLIGARIYSQGTTFVGSDLTVTDNLYLGTDRFSGTKEIIFTQGARISGGSGFAHADMRMTGDYLDLNFLQVSVGKSYNAYAPVLEYDYNDRNRFKISSFDSYNASDKVEIWLDPGSGTVYFRYRGENTHAFYSDGSEYHKGR